MNTENRDELQELIGSDYQLQWIIGHGGMSTVWLADDVPNQREAVSYTHLTLPTICSV